MRIVFISNIFSPHVRGGYELGCQWIAQAMQDAGHEISVVTSSAVGRLRRTAPARNLHVVELFEPVFEYEDLLNQHFERSGIWHERRLRAFGGILPSNAIALKRFLTQHNPDLVWIFNPLGLGPIGLMETVASHPCKAMILLMDDIDGVVRDHQSLFPTAARFRRVKQSFHAISCSRKTLAANERTGSYRQHRVIYNGVKFGSHDFSRPRNHGPFRFIYFGQVEQIKGVMHLLEAASFVRAKRTDLKFSVDIVGRGSEAFKGQITQFIEARRLSEHVNLLGFVPNDQLMQSLSGYDAAVMLLNESEPFGYAPLEASVHGLPVILTAATGVAECFPAGYPLLVKDRTDYEEVASKLLFCMQRREQMTSLTRRLRSGLQAKCDLESVTLPAYMRTIRSCPVNTNLCHVNDLIASMETAAHYGLSS